MTALDDLPRLVQEAEPAALPSIIAALEGAKAAAWARLSTALSAQDRTFEDRLLSLPEVAKALCIPEDRAYDLARQGRLAVVVIGKYKRVRESAVRAFVAANEAGGPIAARGPRRG